VAVRPAAFLVAAACALGTGCPPAIEWEQGRAYPCDGGSGQCPGGWTCGITGLCQPTAPGPYPCLLDRDCASPWRCGADQRCVDPTGDALPPDLPAANASVSLVHPLLFTAPEQLSVSPLTSFPDGRVGRSVAELSSGQITLALHAQDAVARADGGTADLAFAIAPASRLANGPVLALASARRRAFVLYDGGVGQFAPFTAGIPAVTRLPLPFPASALHVTNDADRDTLLVAHDGRRLAVWRLDDDAGFRPAPLPRSVDGGALDVLDVASLASNPLPELVLAATREGLFVGDRADAGAPDPLRWFGLTAGDLFNVPCDGGSQTWIAERAVSAQGILVLEAVDSTRPRDNRRLQALRQDPDQRSHLVPQASNCLAFPTFPPPPPPLFSLPSPCSSAAPVVAASAVPNAPGGTDYRVQCADGMSYVTADLGTPFADFLPDFQAAVTSGDVAFGDGFVLDTGRLWASSVGLVASPITPDPAPAVVLGQGDGLRLLDSQLTPVGRQLKVYRPAPDAGLFLEPRSEALPGEPLAAVEGTDDWVVVERAASPQHIQVVSLRGLSESPVAGVVGELPGSEQFKRPYRALLAPLSDGGTELLVSAFDALLAADVTRLLTASGAPAAAVDVKAVPLSRSPILSIAAVPPRPGEITSGYLLTPSSLFRFGAQSQARWRVEEVLMPRDDWMAVWADGERGRVGYPDGVIYSLPSRVPISRPLPAGPVTDQVRAYTQVCGQPFALTEQGLLIQLLPGVPPDPLGQWQAVLPSKVAFGAPSDFRLHGEGSTVYVVDGQITVTAYAVACN